MGIQAGHPGGMHLELNGDRRASRTTRRPTDFLRLQSGTRRMPFSLRNSFSGSLSGKQSPRLGIAPTGFLGSLGGCLLRFLYGGKCCLSGTAQLNRVRAGTGRCRLRLRLRLLLSRRIGRGHGLGVGYVCYGAEHFRDLVRHIGQKDWLSTTFFFNWPASCSTSGPASNNGSASMMVPKYEKSTDCVPETRADKYI